MKDKIIIFVIGVLVGAIIATGVFYAYTTFSNSNDCDNKRMKMDGRTPPEIPGGQNNERPTRPDGDNNQPPEKPNDNSQNNNSKEE